MALTPLSSDTLVIGAGIAGLMQAYRAKKAGRSVLILEKSKRAGGVIRSEARDGFLLEFGPNTVQANSELVSLIEDLGIASEMQIADAKTPRYIFFQGKLHPVPLSPFSLLGSSLLSWSGKWRLLREPFIKSGYPSPQPSPSRGEGVELSSTGEGAKKTVPSPVRGEGQESVHDFFRRRFGDEVAERLLAPYVSGIWAGDAATLSASAAFPALARWEREKGSILRGAWASFSQKKSSNKSIRGLLTFKNGLETLTRALAEQLKEDIQFQKNPTEIRRPSNGEWEISGPDFLWRGGRVVLAAPAWEASRLVRSFAPEVSATLNNIPYAPLAVLHLGFEKAHVGNAIKGFGFLVAPSEESEILGCLWSSELLPGRAPAGKTLYTVFVGGATNGSVLDAPDSILVSKATGALKSIMKLTGEPVFSAFTRYDRAIPQYTIGHQSRIDILSRTEKSNPGLFFTGNYRGGISVGDVVRNAVGNS